MNGIQIILIVGISVLGIYYIVRLKRSALDMSFFSLLIITAIAFVLWPDLTNTIAHRLGVGRGADLIYYLCILIFSFVLMKLYARTRRLEKQITALIREDALKKARQ